MQPFGVFVSHCIVHTTLHHTTPHYTTLHYTTLHYTTLHYTTLHYTTPHYTTLHYTTLHYTTPQLQHNTLHYTTLHHTTPHHTTLHYATPISILILGTLHYSTSCNTDVDPYVYLLEFHRQTSFVLYRRCGGIYPTNGGHIDFSLEYHEFAVEWGPGRIDWFA